ncbi:hypothetical protein ANCCAN_05306 [Ancylostoma caninum]|uniref:Nuclear envelope integral membrane protein 1 n=1 Tax=Ancylostoma caninum TaxID=29170 RepID=A0A368H064_ANCCA|nr:hypothetical protein ANCCAN_05306 [Ancylostoma caninum]
MAYRVPSLFACFFFLSLFQNFSCTAICKARELENSRWIVPAKLMDGLDLYIHRGLEYSATRAFTDIFLQLNLTDSDTYDLYKGDNCTVVEEDYRMDNRMFGLLKGVDLWKSHQLNVFNDTVVGVVTRQPYSISAKVLKVNYIRLGAFVAGILLFLFARQLVRNAVFYYGSGCSFGLLASLLIVVFIIYRVAPKKLIGIPILIGGWSMSMYMLHFAWRNFATVVVQYQKYLAAYIVTVVAISLAVCYKRGPPKDSRSLDIAQWTMQAVALLVIYAAAQVQEVSIGVMTVLVLHQLTKSWFWCVIRGIGAIGGYFWRKIFPPKRRLLTMEEYEKEGLETTKRELERLRQYCRSPDADVWKITSKVHDPRRFARFVDGKERHVLEEEEDLYESDAEYLDRNDEETDDGDEYDYDDRGYGSQRYFEEDAGDDWEEEVVVRRTPRNLSDNVPIVRKSSSKRLVALPQNGSRLMELTPNSRSTYQRELPSSSRSPYYRESPRSPNSSKRVVSSYSRRYQAERDRGELEYDSPYRRGRDEREYDTSYLRRLKQREGAGRPVQKRTAPSSSNEFLSSDSDADIQEADLYPEDQFEYEA